MSPLPVRTCVGCRRARPQPELVRCVRAPDGRLAVGRTLPGRGAYVCADGDRCIDLARRRRAFGRALRAPVADEAIDSLRAFVTKPATMGSRHM